MPNVTVSIDRQKYLRQLKLLPFDSVLYVSSVMTYHEEMLYFYLRLSNII